MRTVLIRASKICVGDFIDISGALGHITPREVIKIAPGQTVSSAFHLDDGTVLYSEPSGLFHVVFPEANRNQLNAAKAEERTKIVEFLNSLAQAGSKIDDIDNGESIGSTAVRVSTLKAAAVCIDELWHRRPPKTKAPTNAPAPTD